MSTEYRRHSMPLYEIKKQQEVEEMRMQIVWGKGAKAHSQGHMAIKRGRRREEAEAGSRQPAGKPRNPRRGVFYCGCCVGRR